MGLFSLFSALILWAMHFSVLAWLTLFFPILNSKAIIYTVPTILTLITIFGMMFTHSHFDTFSHGLYYFSYTWFGFVFIAFCITGLCALLYWIIELSTKNIPFFLGYTSLILIAIVWGISLWSGFSAPQIKNISIKNPNLPQLKIAVISDSHLGMGVSLARFSNAMEKIKSQNPDILLVLGDVFEFGPHAEKYAQKIADLKPSLGTYGVLGNHEYYGGYQKALDFYKKSGITLLQNEKIELSNELQLVGVKDIRTAHVSKEDFLTLLETVNPNKPAILLSHTPLYAEEAAQNGIDLMLSGHTHNGQIFPFNFLVRLQFSRVYGLFDVEGMKFYITSGMFYWGIPLRFLAPKEIPILEINK